MPLSPTTSVRSTVTSSSQEIGLDMYQGAVYRLCAVGADLYFRVGTASATTASAGNDSHLLADGDSILLNTTRAGNASQRVAVIRAGSVDGACTLSLMTPGS